MKKSEESLEKLITRMPRPVREEVKRLRDEVAALKKAAELRGEVTSRVVAFKSHGDYMPLDEDIRVRFYPKMTEKDSSTDYIELCVDRDPRRELEASVSVRTGHGRLVMLPQGANICTLRTEDL